MTPELLEEKSKELLTKCSEEPTGFLVGGYFAKIEYEPTGVAESK